MLKLILRMTLRRLNRERIYVMVNILGLSLAMACSLSIFAFVRSELAYDAHHQHVERLVRVVNDLTTSGETSSYALTSRALGPLFQKAYPDLADYVRFRNLQAARNLFRYEDIRFYWDDVLLADENVFDVFTHKILYGSVENALKDPSSIAVSRSFAEAYFGKGNPVGQAISTNTFTYHISVVFEDLPDNSHLKYSALISMNRLKDFGLSDDNLSPQMLFGVDTYTYFLLKDGVSLHNFRLALSRFYQDIAARIGEQANISLRYIVQPLQSVHFDNRFMYDQPTGNIFYVYGFIALGIFMLVVACINYTNLATARAIKRSKEIGMTKIIGASRFQIAFQHLAESLLFSLVAFVFGLAIVWGIDSFSDIGQLLGKNSLLKLSQDPLLLPLALLLSVLVGILAGSYPALYLSGISPLIAISQSNNATSERMSFSRVLVFIQFVVSITVVIVTILMSLQMQYIASKPLGFAYQDKVVVTLRGVEVLQRSEVIREQLLKTSGVKGVALSAYVPGVAVNSTLRQLETEQGQLEIANVNQMFASKEFAQVMALEIVDGRDFSMRQLTDIGTSVMVNESLVRKMGWQHPIGKKVEPGNNRVIGVVRDFHFDSLHVPVNPIILMQFQPNSLNSVPDVQRNLVSRYLIVDIDPAVAATVIDTIEQVFTSFDPLNPFEYRYMEDLLIERYKTESSQVSLLATFAVLCIFISCLGLAGLAAFTIEQRSQEISIRKVLGASAIDIIVLIIKSFLLLILIAALLASILSFGVVQHWLLSFAYHTNIQLWVFPLSSLLVAGLAFTTIMVQSWKTAMTNPTKVLRNE